ncbi:hypothetical protein [Actinomadura viridis]|uniref:Uncharacterized protein n=1 Tax=Actinomadura viridis TaxID=58110 RepID=A0A931GI02_9ACTN|nr:hypothetical protein [Actinomadura viridis]MBG6088008.1 hypothetical protein [Actinomadura viridis]
MTRRVGGLAERHRRVAYARAVERAWRLARAGHEQGAGRGMLLVCQLMPSP